MNWGEIQIESLKKMFLNNDELLVSELENYRQNKKYKTYLFAMPQACNEAINYILENGFSLIKDYKLKYKDNTKKYKLRTLVPNFKRLTQVVVDGNSVDWYIEGDNVLVINDWNKEKSEITLYYESYPDRLKNNSSNSTSIDLPSYLVDLIPLYIAGELYKDDDSQLATIYMNEFISNVDNLFGKDYNPNPKSITNIYDMEW